MWRGTFTGNDAWQEKQWNTPPSICVLGANIPLVFLILFLPSLPCKMQVKVSLYHKRYVKKICINTRWKLIPFACMPQEGTCKSWWWGKASRTSLGKRLSLNWEMCGLIFVPLLNPTALERHHEHPGAVLWPKVVSSSSRTRITFVSVTVFSA